MSAKAIEKAQFAERLVVAMAFKNIKKSPTKLQQLFNEKYQGKPVTVHSARNWMLGISMPTQEKLVSLATLLGTSAEHLRFGQHIEKTFVIHQADGRDIELTHVQQQFVRKYILLTPSKQTLLHTLVEELLLT